MSKKERNLSKKEQRRKELFQARVSYYQGLGYEKKEMTMGIFSANLLAVVIMLPPAVMAVFAYAAINPIGLGICPVFFGLGDVAAVLLSLVALTALHEGIHGLTWGIFAGNHFREIEFGIIWKMLTPYCTCLAPLTKKQFVAGALMPTLCLGVLPGAFAIAFGMPGLLFLSLIMLMGGGGDVLIVMKLLRYREKGRECVYLDHPYELGLVVFEKSPGK